MGLGRGTRVISQPGANQEGNFQQTQRSSALLGTEVINAHLGERLWPSDVGRRSNPEFNLLILEKFQSRIPDAELRMAHLHRCDAPLLLNDGENEARAHAAVLASSQRRLGARLACLQASATTAANIWKRDSSGAGRGGWVGLGGAGRPSSPTRKDDWSSGDHTFLPNIPAKLTVAEFWKLVKFSCFHRLSGCALVWSPPPPPPLYARTT